MRIIRRDLYLKRLKSVMGTPDIKVITGIRRSGKSKLLEEFKKDIGKSDKNNIIHVDFNMKKNEVLLNGNALYEYVENNYKSKMKNFLLIDEVQLCAGFENTINYLHAEEKFDIFITGSNAFLMNNDLATLFTGRTFDIEIFPFSFKEFIKYFKYKNEEINQAFDKYILVGGMPGSYIYNEENQKKEYLIDVVNTLIVRDIKYKYNIKNMEVITNLIEYLMDNISNSTSANNITNYLNSKKIKISDKTINNYIEHLCNAFLFYKVKRYDLKGKLFLSSQKKYYLADHSFRYAINGTNNRDIGRIYENIVYIELLRRGYDVYIGTLYQKEVDFVAKNYNERIYIQVCSSVSDEKTFKREIDSLLRIKDNYRKLIITRTYSFMYTYDGIEVYDIVRWLTGDERTL